MEAQTDITTYLEQGKEALARGQGREAAIAYAHGAQIEPENPLVHLGLAEANLALGSNGVVLMACRKTQELASTGPLYHLAQALLDLLDRRYESALQQVDTAIKDDPGNAYAHALRAYLLRTTNQTYDAGLARSRASRLSFGGTFENCFPPIEPVYTNGYQNQPTAFTPPPATSTPEPAPRPAAAPSARQEYQQREQIPPWSRTPHQRRMIRARFWLNQHPRFVTYTFVGLNALVYLVLAFMSQNLLDINLDAVVALGGQVNAYVAQGQIWRVFTAMFIHFNIAHIGLNMLSLFFIGPAVELFYGKWRYPLIYLVSGIIGGVVTYYFSPANTVAAGASGAIFGIFGALGAFYIVNRRALGQAGNVMIGQWVFWLLLNLVYGFSATGIAWQDHLGGLFAGLLLGIILLPPLRRTGRRIG